MKCKIHTSLESLEYTIIQYNISKLFDHDNLLKLRHGPDPRCSAHGTIPPCNLQIAIWQISARIRGRSHPAKALTDIERR